MNTQFWDHLLATVSAIDALADAEQGHLSELRAHLESIDIVFDRVFDPADAYEEYVALALCRAIRGALPKS